MKTVSDMKEKISCGGIWIWDFVLKGAHPVIHYSLVIPPLKVPFHGWWYLGCIDFSEMDSHHLRDASVSSSQVQESLGPPLWADPQQLLELFRRKHKHRATTQKPKTERQVSGKYKNTYGEMESFVSEQLLPIDGSAGDYRTQDGWYKRVIELSEQPARLLNALLEKSLGVWVQVALDEEGLNWISEQLRTALIPLETQEQ